MAKYLGTDDFRGETNRTLTVEHAYKIGRFLGWHYGREHDDREEGDRRQGDREQVDREHKTYRVVIGKDTRRSSYMFEYVLAAGPTTSGADAYLLHVITTPSISYVARTGGLDCGAMISASHNLYHDNDIKFINVQGEKMDEDTVLQAEAYPDGISREIPLAVRERIDRTMDHTADRNQYTDCLISLTIRSYKNMKMGLNCASRSAWMVVKSAFDALRVSAYVTNNEPDGLNINIGCGFTHMEGLIRFVREKKLDVGFAFGGDAGRCLCVGERGNLVDGDLILYIYGRCMEEREKLTGNKIVTTVMSNFDLHKALDKAGIKYEKTTAGDKHVRESMALNGYCIDGGQSDHIIFRKHVTAGNGILTTIKMMEVILEKKQPLSRLAEPIRIYPQVLENIRAKDKQVAREDRDARDAVDRMKQELGTEGCVLVGESGTEPIMRVMVEARDGHKCRGYVDRVIRVMMDKGYQDVLS